MGRNLLNRHVFRELVSLFGLTLVSMLTIILVGRVLQLRSLFMSLSLGLGDMLLLFLYLSPFFLLLLIPVACMLSVFLTFLRMSTDRELLALKTCGLSLYRLVPAPILFSLLCAGLSLIVSLYGISWGMAQFRVTVMELARTRAQLVIQPGVFNHEFPGLVIYARRTEGQGRLIEDVFIEDMTREGIRATILAPEGTVETDSEKGRIQFALNNGKIYRREGEKMSVLSFASYMVNLDLSRLLQGVRLGVPQPKELSWSKLSELRREAGAAETVDVNFYRKVLVERHKRWALPLSCMVLGLFALPLACVFEGLKRQYGVLLALGMFLIYYILFSLGTTMGEAGALPPAVGLWLPNAVFLGMVVYGLRLAAAERAPRVAEWLLHIWGRRKERRCAS